MSRQDDLEVIEIEEEQPELEIEDENHQPTASWSRHGNKAMKIVSRGKLKAASDQRRIQT